MDISWPEAFVLVSGMVAFIAFVWIVNGGNNG